jgi:hypothetical protein
MEERALPSVQDLAALTAVEVEHLARRFDRARRCAEADAAVLLHRVDVAGVAQGDGFRQVSSWGIAACRWSVAESKRLVRLGRSFVALPRFAAACLEGEVGVEAMHSVAATAANPRVAHHLADPTTDELFTRWATELHHDQLVTVLARWTALADVDGARSRHDRAHRQRHARLCSIGERCFLDAAASSTDGLLLHEVFQQFLQMEWRTDWDAGVARWGDAMRPDLMQRTPGQRSFDALLGVFRAAAGSQQLGGEVVVNIVVDQATFEHHLARATGHEPAPLEPLDAEQRRCESPDGTPVDPRAMIAAALVGHVRRVVLDAAGVIVDLGRRQRLLTGAAREALLLTEPHCVWPGCRHPARSCDVDHTIPFSQGGATSTRNSGPMCPHHNRWKHRGYRTWRDPEGWWHTYRPDGTEIGWPTRRRRSAAA